MSSPIWLNLHYDFRLNGIQYSAEDLGEVGYSLIKEGEPFEVSMGEFFLDWISPKEELSVSTSGSTGKPKTIMIRKEWMINSARATGNYFNLESGDKALLCLPCTSIAGKMMLVRAMVLGLHLDYVEPTANPLEFQQKTYDFVAMVPLQVKNALEKLSKVKKLIIGGAPMSEGLKKELQKASGKVYETYGMTETVSHIAIRDLNQNKHYFQALPNVKFSQDERGCLVIHAPKLTHQQVETNDLVELIDETRFIWLGRHDGIINSGGIKLIPEQIEQKLALVIPSRFFISGLPDENLGERLVLVVENIKCDKVKLMEQIKRLKGLDKYEVPREIICLETFAETTTGKIQRDKTLALIV
ncbi:AMP-binding protein [Muricauda sp. JGD-17]|uniref:AMP-binding protein n=1 Tax=Flagellimonas ochracea TaxID=2696472 RepID=A0A964TAA8_9FLAO|nr:AMP-binding protein [Allomuricauda ochracea]NAY91140.1 AMP-binding protein [Allomuricauda ochracea]